MPDLNQEALAVWDALKPMIDQEITSKTQGMVQRRKAKVTTAPSLVTNTIGVTEAFGRSEMFLPFVSNIISANVGDFVWVEWMYGATNAFVSSFASVDKKNKTVAGDLTVNGNTTLNGVLDVTNRRAYATLSEPGWYRVLTCAFSDAWLAKGGSGLVVNLQIVRRGSSAIAESHAIKYRSVNNGNGAFSNEESKSGVQYIDKIRYTYDESSFTSAIDIHYAASANNNVSVYFDCYVMQSNQKIITSSALSSVADAPAGETVQMEYAFSANTEADGAFTTETGISVNEVDIKRSGRCVYVRFYATGTISANTVTTLGTLSGVPLPSKNIRWLASGGSAAYNATTPVYAILDTSGVLKIYSNTAIGAVNITLSYIV